MLKYSRPIVNLSLRGITLGCRFLLIIFLAKLLSPEQVGLFGLVSATIVMGQLLIGGEYYTYSQRELISKDRIYWSFVLQHQLLALALLYLVLSPILLGVFHFGVLPFSLIGWFFCILISESVAQELNRVMIAMQCQLTASCILFFRHGLWVLFVLPVMWIDPESRSLDLIFTAWFVGCSAAICLGLMFIKKEVGLWKIWPVDTRWIKKGFRVSLLYLAGAICFRAFFTIDRFAVENLLGLDFLGAYVVYIGLAMALVTVLDPLIFAFSYPKLIGLVRDKRYLEFNITVLNMLKSVILIGLSCVGIVVLMAPFVFEWINKPLYITNLPVLWVLLAVAMSYGLSMVPHFGLYALGHDKTILIIHLLSLILFLVSLIILPYLVPLRQVVGGSLLAGFCCIGMLKFWFFARHNREFGKVSNVIVL